MASFRCYTSDGALAKWSEASYTFLNAIADRMDAIIGIYKTTMAHRQTAQASEDRFSWLAVSMVAFIVLVAAFLTYRGKIDGSTFTFLLGLIVGYLLTFVRDQITGGPGE